MRGTLRGLGRVVRTILSGRGRALSPLAAVAALGLAGCQIIPSSGPNMELLSSQEGAGAQFVIVDLTPETIGTFVRPSLPDVATIDRRRVGAPRPSISAGDVLKITIFEGRPNGTFAPASAGGTVFQSIRVHTDGTIQLPYVGVLRVSGLVPQQVEQRIQAGLQGNAFEPRALVEVLGDRASSVFVSGAVKVPGRYSLYDGIVTVVDAINKAGGPVAPPLHTDVVLRRGKTHLRYNLAEMMRARDMAAQGGDDILVEAKARTFVAFGAITKPGIYEFTRQSPTLLEALGQVGGLADDRASRPGVFVFRWQPPDKNTPPKVALHKGMVPTVLRLDITKPESVFVAGLFPLAPDDVVYVSNAPIHELSKVLNVIGRFLGMARGLQ